MSRRKDFSTVALAHARSRGAPGTRRLYERDLEDWLQHCELEGTNPAAPTLESATSFRDELLQEKAALTVRRTIAALSSMYEAALASENPAASWNPFKRLPRPKADEYARTEVLSGEDVARLLAAIREDSDPIVRVRDMAIVRLLYETGCRISTVLSAERAKVACLSDGTVIRDVFLKGGKRGELHVPATAASALEAWLSIAPPSKWVFPARSLDRPVQKAAINKRLGHYGKVAGIEHLHPHRFRAAFITDALDSGVPLQEVCASVGHADPATTLRYDRSARGSGVASALAEYRGKNRS